jgi:hypothetical protein
MRVSSPILWILSVVLGTLILHPPLLFAVEPAGNQQPAAKVPLQQNWWESASAVRNLSLKDDTVYPQLSLDPAKATAQLQALKQQGFAGIQVFGPADGGKSYNGLDSATTTASSRNTAPFPISSASSRLRILLGWR